MAGKKVTYTDKQNDLKPSCTMYNALGDVDEHKPRNTVFALFCIVHSFDNVFFFHR